MGIWIDVKIQAYALTEGAKERLLALDLSEFMIEGFSIGVWKGYYSSSIVKNDFDWRSVMNCVAEALGNEGAACAIETCEEDIPYKIAYYYLCDGIKQIDLLKAKRNIFLKMRVHEMLKQMDENDVTALYAEVFRKPPINLEFEDIKQALEQHFSSERYVSLNRVKALSRNKGEKAVSFINQLAAFAKKHKIEIESDFPTLEWEEKGIVRFSEKERKALADVDMFRKVPVKQIRRAPKSAYITFEYSEDESRRMMEAHYAGIHTLDEALAKNKEEAINYEGGTAAFDYAMEPLDRTAEIQFLNKHFAITGFEDRYPSPNGIHELLPAVFVEDIQRRGGIVHSRMTKGTNYLVVCVGTPHYSCIRDALSWRKKGADNCIVSDYQLLQAYRKTNCLSEDQLMALFDERDRAMRSEEEQRLKKKKEQEAARAQRQIERQKRKEEKQHLAIEQQRESERDQALRIQQHQEEAQRKESAAFERQQKIEREKLLQEKVAHSKDNVGIYSEAKTKEEPKKKALNEMSLEEKRAIYAKQIVSNPTILFIGKRFVFAGVFKSSDILDDQPIVKAIKKKGGHIRKTVSQVTDYLVVSSVENSEDAKMRKAVECYEEYEKPEMILLKDLEEALGYPTQATPHTYPSTNRFKLTDDMLPDGIEVEDREAMEQELSEMDPEQAQAVLDAMAGLKKLQGEVNDIGNLIAEEQKKEEEEQAKKAEEIQRQKNEEIEARWRAAEREKQIAQMKKTTREREIKETIRALQFEINSLKGLFAFFKRKKIQKQIDELNNELRRL